MKTRSFDFPVSVADTETGPVINWERQELRLQFETYLKQRCCFRFLDVCHFELLSEDELDPAFFRYDGVVEVLESPLLSLLVSVGEIPADQCADYTHLVIGFNEIGSYLVVIFRQMQFETKSNTGS